jgi:hypothetical protein
MEYSDGKYGYNLHNFTRSLFPCSHKLANNNGISITESKDRKSGYLGKLAKTFKVTDIIWPNIRESQSFKHAVKFEWLAILISNSTTVSARVRIQTSLHPECHTNFA